MDRRAALLAFALLGLALAAFPARGSGPTYVSGEITASDWTIDGSPYVIVDNATIPAAHTLTIGPGVVVRANHATGLHVLGGLVVAGTSAQPVLFTANATIVDPGYWTGIYGEGASISFTYTNVEGAQGALGLLSSFASVASSSLGSSNYGVVLTGGMTNIVDSSISLNTQAGVMGQGTISVRSTLFANNYVSLNLMGSHALVENSTFLAPTVADLMLDTGSVVALRNSTQEGFRKFVDASSRLDIESFLAVTVRDGFGTPVPAASVAVEDNANGTARISTTTEMEGRAPLMVVRERTIDQATTPLGVDFNPFTVTAVASGTQGSSIVTVHRHTDVTVTLPRDVTPPIAIAARALAVDEGVPLTLDASASTDNDPNFGSTGVYRWSFPDLGVDLAGAMATYTFPVPGVYDGVLTVTDAVGNTAILTFTVTVRDTKAPTITDVKAPTRGLVGETLAFTATASDNDPKFAQSGTFVWRFTLGGETFERDGGAVSVSFDKPGSWTVTVTTEDAGGNPTSAERTVVIEAPVTPPAPNPWPWIGGGLALLAAAIGLATERGKVGLFTLFLPLYTRIKDARVLDQFTRGQIYGYIRVHPGDTYTDIKRNLALNNGTLTYHLDVLERQGMIRARTSGARKMFYSLEVRAPEDGGGLHEIQQRMLRVIAEAPGAAISDVGGILGISRQLATYHARLLAQQGLVRLERRGVRLCAVPLGPKV